MAYVRPEPLPDGPCETCGEPFEFDNAYTRCAEPGCGAPVHLECASDDRRCKADHCPECGVAMWHTAGGPCDACNAATRCVTTDCHKARVTPSPLCRECWDAAAEDAELRRYEDRTDRHAASDEEEDRLERLDRATDRREGRL